MNILYFLTRFFFVFLFVCCCFITSVVGRVCANSAHYRMLVGCRFSEFEDLAFVVAVDAVTRRRVRVGLAHSASRSSGRARIFFKEILIIICRGLLFLGITSREVVSVYVCHAQVVVVCFMQL